MDKVEAKVKAMLQWRRENNIDEIRNDILYGGKDSPSKFPYANIVLKYAYQIVITHDVFDYSHNVVSLETFNFDPKEVMKLITVEQYLRFLAYTLEYKALVLEQLSEEREKKYLEEHNNSPPYDPKGYGVIVQVNIIPSLSPLSSLSTLRMTLRGMVSLYR